MPNQSKRHHFVPEAYLKAFCDESGRLLVYRKDEPSIPLHVAPNATQFRRYYYSQPTPAGGRDNNTLEALFSKVESEWPETVATLHRRENVNDRLENIFQFMALQRVRVPAARDVVEAMLAQTVKDSMKTLISSGEIPPPPPGYEDLPNRVDVTIDPHQSIHAMVDMMKGMEKLYSALGFIAVQNATPQQFLTSDNPVLWFDPSLSFDDQRPYTINTDGGEVLLMFPISPRIVLMGSTKYKSGFDRDGLVHTDAPDANWVDLINTQICRFAYEAVLAQRPGHEELIAKFASVSPVYDAVTFRTADGMTTAHQQVFGSRTAKRKWRNE